MSKKEKLLYYVRKKINDLWSKNKIIEIEIPDIANIYLSEPDKDNDKFIEIELLIGFNNKLLLEFINSINFTYVDLDLFLSLIEKLLNEYEIFIEEIKIT